MRFPLVILFAIVVFTACKGKNKIPADVLTQKKMQAVMWDMMRVDHFLTDYVFSKDPKLDKTAESFKYYQQIFSIHQTNTEQFRKSYSFYTSHPNLFKAIMDSLSKPVVAEEAPTQVVKPVSVEDSFDSLTKPLPKTDTVIRLRKKKGFPLQ